MLVANSKVSNLHRITVSLQKFTIHVVLTVMIAVHRLSLAISPRKTKAENDRNV